MGFSSLNSEFEGSDSEGDIETFHGALFAGVQNKNLRGDAVFVYRKRDFTELLPWDFIDHGFKKSLLWKEYQKAKRA